MEQVVAWGAALRLWVLPAAAESFGHCPDHTRPDEVFCVTQGLDALVRGLGQLTDTLG